tara:strand:+ start:174 stop:371 length:198 start_codon:yes stop_codon:yes gene_type:complete
MVKWTYPPYSSEETSVCIKICRLNMAQTHCIGCKRSLLEIEQWRNYSIERKKELIKELDVRLITD